MCRFPFFTPKKLPFRTKQRDRAVMYTEQRDKAQILTDNLMEL